MKSRDHGVCLTVFAALTIIASSLSAMALSRKRRGSQTKTLKEAVQNWEAEGGAVLPEPEETPA